MCASNRLCWLINADSDNASNVNSGSLALALAGSTTCSCRSYLFLTRFPSRFRYTKLLYTYKVSIYNYFRF
jgi:hypothetical protein